MFGCGVRFHFRSASAGALVPVLSKRGTHNASSSRSDLDKPCSPVPLFPGQRILYAANRDQTQIQLQRSHQI